MLQRLRCFSWLCKLSTCYPEPVSQLCSLHGFPFSSLSPSLLILSQPPQGRLTCISLAPWCLAYTCTAGLGWLSFGARLSSLQEPAFRVAFGSSCQPSIARAWHVTGDSFSAGSAQAWIVRPMRTLSGGAEGVEKENRKAGKWGVVPAEPRGQPDDQSRGSRAFLRGKG